MRFTRYIVASRFQKYTHYPQFNASGELIGWVRRFDAQRFTRDEAITAARQLRKHLDIHNAPDHIEIRPASGGAQISWNVQP